MEISRRRVVNGVSSRSASKVPLEQILSLDTVEVAAVDPKFAGYKGCSVSALLGAAKDGTGIFAAGDGMLTDPIGFDILVTGVVLHTDPSGQPLEHGGPLRLYFPPDANLRCSSGNPLTVKDVRSLELTVAPKE
jgi:hypothetical protein